MTHPIIKTDNYLLVVDESEIKERDWMYYKHFGEDIVCKYDRINGENTNVNEHKPFYQKIIYHLPLNMALILEGVPLLPPLEDEVEKLAFDYTSVSQSHRRGFIDGYNKSKEKYKYTKEDMMKAMEFARTFSSSMTDNHYIQSLQQPKYPVAFVLSDNFSNFTENFKHEKYIYE